MAHQIERNEDLFSVREIPWHGLGVIVQDAPNSEEALRLGGLDWDVLQEPVCRANGEQVEPYLFNVREDNGRVLGLVKSRYQVLQNKDAFSFTDSLLDAGEVLYETAGCLNGGERVWLLARLPEYKLLGDVVEPYLCFTHGHNGRHPINVALTPIRVVCNNTLSLSLATAIRVWSTKHQGRIERKLEEAKITLGLANTYLTELNKTVESLAVKKIEDHKIENLVEQLFPFPEDDSVTARKQSLIFTQRDGVLSRYRHTPDLQDYRGTAWGFVGAVSDFVTHSKPARKTERFKERRFESVIDGIPVLDRAVELAKAA